MSLKRLSRELSTWLSIIVERVQGSQRTQRLLISVLLAISIILAIVIRTAPFGLNGFEFFEFDSYIEYWQAKYVYEKGPLAWYTLTRSNPDTHIFWYPWGRDFIFTSYPFLPMWIGTTYHVVKVAGLTLERWAALQPVLFASIAVVLAYFAGKEVSGSRISGVIASLLLAVLPSAVERSVIGYVEKEGVAAVFVMLFVYYYAKLLRGLYTTTPRNKLLLYTILASLFLALVGWLWGGYVFILGTVVAYIVISPILIKQYLNKNFILYNILLVVLAMVFALPSPASSNTLGIYPFKLRGLWWALIGATLLALIYYYLSVEYRKLGFRKPLLTTGRYIALLVLVIVAGGVLTVLGILPIGGRLAWALGLRFIPVQPLVESIAEHQSPLSSTGMVLRMLQSWGSPVAYLVFASPLFMSVLGAFYLIYKNTPEKVYLAVAFAVAFYSYLNAVYMIGAAAYFGVLVAACFTGVLISKLIPTRVIRAIKTRAGKTRRESTAFTRTSTYTKILVLLLVIAVFTNTAYTAYVDYTLNSSMLYTFRSGVSGVPYYTDSWYRAIEAIKSTPPGSLVIAWWDYGYGISVPGGRASAADGSTINNTQIGIVGLILLSNTTEEAARLAKLLGAESNTTFLMVIEGLFISESGNETVIWPILTGGVLPGIVDWPKSIWMIRIGNSVVEELRSKGINVSYIDTSKFLYWYSLGQGGGVLSPQFNNPTNIPLIYRIIVDAALYWASSQNKTARFCWITGREGYLDRDIQQLIRDALKIDVVKEITYSDIGCIYERPLINDSYLVPYAVIVEPFKDPVTREPFKLIYMRSPGVLYSVIVIYKFTEIPETS
ncbi:MAG: peptide transporter [Desulfurococcaceae archaeon]|nr:peptide transporter [Desulfurococcaceae archaeon]